MKRLRVLALMDSDLVPPDSMEGYTDEEMMDWKSEYDVVTTLRELGHEVLKVGVHNDLKVLQESMAAYQPEIVFNLLEEFHGVALYDQHVVAYLELMKQAYTGCNPRGLMLAHDKVLSKQILCFHHIPTPRFVVYKRGSSVRPPRRLRYPLIAKSTTEDASFGLSAASIVNTPEELIQRVQSAYDDMRTDVLVEEYIEGREFYVSILGNMRLQVMPVWELLMTRLPKGEPNIATAEIKWNYDRQAALGVETRAVADLPSSSLEKIKRIGKRVYRALCLSGYARIDLRMDPQGRVYVLEANPNPNLSYGEDFAEAADTAGIPYEVVIQRILRLGLQYRAAWRGTA